VGEEEHNKDRKKFGSPSASDFKLFEQTSERDETSPLNTSGIFESVRHFSENEEDRLYFSDLTKTAVRILVVFL